jgi:hypothetical protein
MKKIALMLLAVSVAGLSQAALKPGDNLSPYVIHNVATGKEYCQVCAYGAKQGKIIAFGKLNDESFWTDLQKLQKIQNANPKLGVFAQVIDSKDSDVIKAAADKHGITFPVVVAVEKDWNKKYDINGASRIIYYAHQKNDIVWTSSNGLDSKSADELGSRVKKDLAG